MPTVVFAYRAYDLLKQTSCKPLAVSGALFSVKIFKRIGGGHGTFDVL
jgi:hypothetical protein